jgi:hypothetical protein
MPRITAPGRPDGRPADPATPRSPRPALASECEAVLKECLKTRAAFVVVAERFRATLEDARTRRSIQRQHLYEALARNQDAGTRHE